MNLSKLIVVIGFLHAICLSVLYGADRTFIKGMPAGQMTIDGLANEVEWEQAEWYPINVLWLGSNDSDADFKGDYKVLWDSSAIYILAKITDDVFHDHYSDPLTSYWKDDCLEIFVDEDFSGGDHKHNYNAFAYHISMFYDVVDLGADSKPHLFNDNLEVMRTNIGNEYIWEIRMPLYTDEFVYGAENNPVRKISLGDTIGLSIAYCDNDGGTDRESFMGSVEIEGADKNTSWKDATVFGALVLEIPNTGINAHHPINKQENHVAFIYPNPVTDLLYIKKDNIHGLSVRLYTTDGKLVLNTQVPKNQQNLDVSKLPVGFYSIHITDNSGDVSKGKLIKKEK